MKKLPPAQHKALLATARNNAATERDPYSAAVSAYSKLQWTQEKKLLKRGYLVHEIRQLSKTCWSQQCWLSKKGQRYLGR